jgi:UDP-N-acetylmuramate--alanine ligase
MFSPLQALHFTGIGGIGMSALARLGAGSGLQISGSDLKASRATEQLAALGVTVAEGHSAGNVPAAAEALIITSAAAGDNPEIAEARRRGLPIATRGELLGALMRRRRAAAVAGSHGKTTVTSLLIAIALEAGLDPTAAVGAFLPALGNANARLGAGAWFIAESDESDGSFLQIHPEIAVLTNIDREHLDHYGTFDNARSAFVRFINQTALHGAAAVCLDDDEVRAALPRFRCRLLTYGQHPDARLRLLNAHAHAAGGDFEAALDGLPLGAFHTPLLGAHNLLNSAAALAAACLMGIEPAAARRALAGFAGPSRRLEFRGEAQGITVVDDYGHHPTEVRATLAALRLLAPHRLVVLFQPHRFTRTQALLDEFATAFHDAHAVRVLDIYAASEPPLPGLDAELFARRLKEAGHPDAVYAGSVHGAAASTLIELRPGDLVLTLGAGSVTEAGPLILKGLREVNPHG